MAICGVIQAEITLFSIMYNKIEYAKRTKDNKPIQCSQMSGKICYEWKASN